MKVISYMAKEAQRGGRRRAPNHSLPRC